MKKRYWILIAIAGITVIVMSAYHYLQLPKRGDLAPVFTLKDVSGQGVSLEQYRGKVVFLHFWATWCNLCRYELPFIERLHQRFKGEGLVVLSVLEDDTTHLDELILESDITYPILVDADAKVADEYMVYGVPETFIINKEGIIERRLAGFVNWEEGPAASELKELLAK